MSKCEQCGKEIPEIFKNFCNSYAEAFEEVWEDMEENDPDPYDDGYPDDYMLDDWDMHGDNPCYYCERKSEDCNTCDAIPHHCYWCNKELDTGDACNWYHKIRWMAASKWAKIKDYFFYLRRNNNDIPF
jgi:hypothetical protein